jgi:hypothetical protein
MHATKKKILFVPNRAYLSSDPHGRQRIVSHTWPWLHDTLQKREGEPHGQSSLYGGVRIVPATDIRDSGKLQAELYYN